MKAEVTPGYVKGLFHHLVKSVGGVEAAGAYLGVTHQRVSQLQSTACADMPTIMQVATLEDAAGNSLVFGALARMLAPHPTPGVLDAVIASVGSSSGALQLVHDAHADGELHELEVAAIQSAARVNLDKARKAYDAALATKPTMREAG